MPLPKLFLLSTLLLIGVFSSGQSNPRPSVSSTAFGFVENKGQIRDQTGQTNAEVKYMVILRNGMKVQLKESGFSY
jgi:hypothetical protein